MKRKEEEKRKYEEQQKFDKAIKVELQMMALKREEQKRKQQREEEIKKTIAENEKTTAKIYEVLQIFFSDFAEKNNKAQECLDVLTVNMTRLREANDTSITAMHVWRTKFNALGAHVMQEEDKESEERGLKFTIKSDNTSWNIERTRKEQQEQKKLEDEERLRTLKKGPRERITPEDQMAEEERLRSLKRGARKKITPEERIAEEKRRQDELERLRALKKGPREKVASPEIDTEEESRAVATGLQIEQDLDKFVGGESDKKGKRRRRGKEKKRN